MQVLHPSISDPLRLKSVDQAFQVCGTLGADFDRLAKLASVALGTPVSLVTLIDGGSQKFLAACGLPAELEQSRETPLDYAICKLCVADRQAIEIPDTLEDERTSRNPVVTEMGVRSYLGFPLMTTNGQVLGGFCAIDFEPRVWVKSEIDILREFAALAVWQIELAAKYESTRAALDLAVHDLRTPLSEICMASAMFGEQIDHIPHYLHYLLSVVKNSTDHAIDLLKGISEDNRSDILSTCENPAAIVSGVLERMACSASAKSMRFDFTHNGSRSLEAKPWVLDHILENLVSNAVKFGPPGTTVTVHLEHCDRFGSIRVRDEGPGFTEADLPLIFQRYVKLSAVPTGNEISTGLGLSISKRLAHQNGGTLELIAAPGKSAEFEIKFPISSSTSKEPDFRLLMKGT